MEELPATHLIDLGLQRLLVTSLAAAGLGEQPAGLLVVAVLQAQSGHRLVVHLYGRVACLELFSIMCGAVGRGSRRYVVEGDDGVEGVGQLAVAGEVLHRQRGALLVV